MTTPERIQRIAEMIGALCPLGHSIEVNLRRYAHPNGDIVVVVHGLTDYAEATKVCRLFDVQKRKKSTWNDPTPRTSLEGEIAPGITLLVFAEGLPPSCRLEKIVERMPKQETRDTGEFIEIERTKIVCGHGEPQAAQESAA